MASASRVKLAPRRALELAPPFGARGWPLEEREGVELIACRGRVLAGRHRRQARPRELRTLSPALRTRARVLESFQGIVGVGHKSREKWSFDEMGSGSDVP